MKYFIIAILLLFPGTAKAGFHIGSSIIATGNKNLSPSYSIGYYKEIGCKGCIIDFATNALFETENTVRERGYKIDNKLTYVSILIGKRFKKYDKYIVPSFLIAGVKSDNSIYIGEYNISRETKHAIILGANINVFLTDNISFSSAIVIPNEKLDSKWSTIFGLNYYF